jgi:hypothetical protein
MMHKNMVFNAVVFISVLFTVFKFERQDLHQGLSEGREGVGGL